MKLKKVKIIVEPIVKTSELFNPVAKAKINFGFSETDGERF